MSASYDILTRIYETLSQDGNLTAIAKHIVTSPTKPEGLEDPTLHVWVRSDIESPSVGVLSDVLFDFAVHDKDPDGVGSTLANIFEAADKLVNDVVFKTDGAVGRLTRKGFSVGYGIYDQYEKEYIKRWTYRAIIKTK